GKTLTGVLPPEKQPPIQNFLPQYNQPMLLDIESCIDDPFLGHHVKKPSIVRKKKNKSEYNGQVQIDPKHNYIASSTGAGLVMLRRRGLEADQLGRELDHLLLPSLTSYLKQSFGPNEYTSLVELDISRNRLTRLPDQIRHLTHLRILNVTSNQLTHIPPELYALQDLQVLILSQNKIQSIPEDMPRLLPNLVTFRIAANLIEKLPSRLDYWQHMRHFQLGSVYGGNRLVQLPDSITDMSLLEELDVSYNQLRSLPHDLAIQSLQFLNVSNNQLDFIPKSITQCQQLKSLNVSKNHLTTLPADLVSLSQLELLDISENLLCIMPAEILERMQSANLLITGNPLTRPGHCDQSSQDAYSRILRQMTQRGVTRSPAASPKLSRVDQCGPRAMEPSSSFCITHPQQDEDASIDHELSYHAQQLNIDGSRPPVQPLYPSNDLIGTSRSKIVQDSTHSTYVLVDFPRESPLPTETKLLHSLREIASRTILKHKLEIPFDCLPAHLAQDMKGERTCAYCQGPFVNEWVTSVQVKGFGGHPAVVRRVRFCSTECWSQCLPTKEHSKSVICVHQ
ncbi:hypothetical protein CU098_003214, partial [Rhizopus stolonifer]